MVHDVNKNAGRVGFSSVTNPTCCPVRTRVGAREGACCCRCKVIPNLERLSQERRPVVFCITDLMGDWRFWGVHSCAYLYVIVSFFATVISLLKLSSAYTLSISLSTFLISMQTAHCLHSLFLLGRRAMLCCAFNLSAGRGWKLAPSKCAPPPPLLSRIHIDQPHLTLHLPAV